MGNTIKTWCVRLVASAVVILTGNLPILYDKFLGIWGMIFLLVFYFIVNIKPTMERGKITSRRLRFCYSGCELLRIFLISMLISAVYILAMIPVVFKENKLLWLLNLLCVFWAEAVVFWNGIIRLYISSVQIGIKWRVIGIMCGFIPIVNLIVLTKLMRLASNEVSFENEKNLYYLERKNEKICDTKYPILMVHGVFFRDFRYFNYWGRIPKELKRHGARIYYGNHQSAASVADSGRELSERIMEVLKETGASKVNVIAHSKGGLDTRYAISRLGMSQYVASLTTINTPHRGCEFADYLLDLNEEVVDQPNVYYQSVGSKLNVASGGRFPLNFSYELVKYFDGSNDGLVSESSFPWGEDYHFLTVDGKRGISHGDMIDLNRENIQGFDVREFYVELVHGLKEKGL
ncbi:MAG: esterase/lipase family protein [Lachnospiraceae bacterium]